MSQTTLSLVSEVDILVSLPLISVYELQPAITSVLKQRAMLALSKTSFWKTSQVTSSFIFAWTKGLQKSGTIDRHTDREYKKVLRSSHLPSYFLMLILHDMMTHMIVSFAMNVVGSKDFEVSQDRLWENWDAIQSPRNKLKKKLLLLRSLKELKMVPLQNLLSLKQRKSSLERGQQNLIRGKVGNFWSTTFWNGPLDIIRNLKGTLRGNLQDSFPVLERCATSGCSPLHSWIVMCGNEFVTICLKIDHPCSWITGELLILRNH